MTRRRHVRQTPHPEGRRASREPESVAVLTIERIAAGGDGVGRKDGLAVFVPRTAPGDVVQVAYVPQGRHGRGRVLQVLTPSPVRVEARCEHYERDHCGGCQLQHLEAGAQREARRQIVQDTLARIGRRDVPLPPLEFDASWEYRSRLMLTLRRRGAGWVGGFHPYDDASRIFPLASCLIAHPLLVDVWRSVSSLLRHPTIPVPSGTGVGQGGDSDPLRLGLRLEAPTDAGGDAGVVLVFSGGTEWPEREAWTELVRQHDPRVRAVWWTPARPAHGGRPVSASRRVSATAGTATGGERNDYAPDGQEALAFAQVNAGIAERLRAHVLAAVLSGTPRRVLDGYAGTGRLSERLASHGVHVVAVESDPAGAEAAAQRLQRLQRGAAPSANEGAGTSVVVCDLMERAIAALDQSFDVVVLNPPRRGVHPAVTAWLEAPAHDRLSGVVYVSCDPATLARDLARLPSWRVESVHCFDMFPQTAHVETVCVLRRETA